MSTAIEWTDETWNPLAAFDLETGKRGWICVHASPGCNNCYAEKTNLWRGNGHKYRVPELPKVEIRLVNLFAPLAWREPRRVFPCSMTDLFLDGEDAYDTDDVAMIFAVMALARWHTFQVLTKRAAGAQLLLSDPGFQALVAAYVNAFAMVRSDPDNRRPDDLLATAPDVAGKDWPLPNVWLGVSVENQQYADERIPHLLDTPAAVRFLSCEPLLGPVDLNRIQLSAEYNITINTPGAISALTTDREDRYYNAPASLDWVIVGGESGAKARPMELQWTRSIVEQCQAASVACFVKQLGARPVEIDGSVSHFSKKGGEWSEWPYDLRVREFPAVAT